jgi:hypothetical protein
VVVEVFVIVVEVVGGVGGECGLGLGGEGWVGGCVGHGSCSAVVLDVADGEVACSDEEEARRKKCLLASCMFEDGVWCQTYKITTPRTTVPVLSLHFPGLPYPKASHPLFFSLSLSLSSPSSLGPALFPAATYDATATHALNQKMENRISRNAKA